MPNDIRFTKENKYGAFSNFSAHPITWIYNGVELTARTSEHAYIWAKFYRTNLAFANSCLEASTPGRVKRMGGPRGKGVLDPDWEKPIKTTGGRVRARKLVIMKSLLVRKTLQNDDVRELLLSTGEATLVEYAPWGDRYWGIDKNHEGLNWLGRLWMEVRQELRQQDTAAAARPSKC